MLVMTNKAFIVEIIVDHEHDFKEGMNEDQFVGPISQN
jgi:hypothetical protein